MIVLEQWAKHIPGRICGSAGEYWGEQGYFRVQSGALAIEQALFWEGWSVLGCLASKRIDKH